MSNIKDFIGASSDLISIDSAKKVLDLINYSKYNMLISVSRSWVCPATGRYLIIATGGGGGGAGGRDGNAGASAGGSSGFVTSGIYSYTIGDNVTVTIGAGGAKTLNGDGGNGGQTAFGNTLLANGGGGGKSTTPYDSGNGWKKGVYRTINDTAFVYPDDYNFLLPGSLLTVADKSWGVNAFYSAFGYSGGGAPSPFSNGGDGNSYYAAASGSYGSGGGGCANKGSSYSGSGGAGCVLIFFLGGN